MRVALLSNVTVDLLAEMLKKSGEVYLASGFDTWQQEILMPGSGLYAYRPEAVIVLLHANACPDIWADAAKALPVLDEWCALFKTVCERLPGVPVFVSELDASGTRCQHGAALKIGQHIENYLAERIEALHGSGSSIYLLPVKELITDLGRKDFYSAKMWYIGSMPYSMKGLRALAELIVRYAGMEKRSRKKCIAVDLDNTLWGGVIGEDGVNGILLSASKEGARYKDAQRFLKRMKEQGVLLAILSKNNAADVEPVFTHADMLLQHDDFAAEAINWDPKSDNIRQMAKALNIGLDSFVFLDDNPVEREEMRLACPEVTVIDFPKDTAQLPNVVAKIYDEHFFTLEVTGEDSQKTAMYKAESQRRAELGAAPSVEDFLRGLQMTVDIHYMHPEEENRVVQLINKTNQFNVTTKRYTQAQVHGFSQASCSDIITVSMADKYGNVGLVSVLIMEYDGQDAGIDTFLMSCRVMGRSLEIELMACVKELLQAKKVNTVRANYIPTAKNAPVAQLFDTLGFRVKREEDGRKEYLAAVAELPQRLDIYKEVKTDL